ncbi:TPA: hypothetical protein ACOTG6_001413 [Clostridium perfringens]
MDILGREVLYKYNDLNKNNNVVKYLILRETLEIEKNRVAYKSDFLIGFFITKGGVNEI